MARDVTHRLVEYLSRRIGDRLQTVAIAANGGYELGYIHDDLSERYTKQTLTAAVTGLQVKASFSSPGSDSSPANERHAVVYYYEDAFVPQFPFSEMEQIIISIGAGFGTDLLRPIEDCRRIVDRKN